MVKNGVKKTGHAKDEVQKKTMVEEDKEMDKTDRGKVNTDDGDEDNEDTIDEKLNEKLSEIQSDWEIMLSTCYQMETM